MSESAKRVAIELLDREYQAMDQLFRSLSDEGLERPVFTGEGQGWRVRDLIAQGTIPADGQGMLAFLDEPPGTDARNDENFREWRDRPVDDALAHLRTRHRRLVDGIRALPPERVVKSDAAEDWYRYFWQPGLNHLRQHRVHIESSLKEGSRA